MKNAVSKRYQKIRNLEIIYIIKSFKNVFYMWEIWKESEEDSSQKNWVTMNVGKSIS